jgi:hypothetical protein
MTQKCSFVCPSVCNRHGKNPHFTPINPRVRDLDRQRSERASTQAVSRQSVTVETRVQHHANTCGGKSGTTTGLFSEQIVFPPSVACHLYTTHFIHMQLCWTVLSLDSVVKHNIPPSAYLILGLRYISITFMSQTCKKTCSAYLK